MTAITKSSQLVIFSTIRDILRTSSILNEKFRKEDYYEFEPKVKSHEFNGFPFIIISIPEAVDDTAFVGDLNKEKTFTVSIRMIIDWRARDKVSRYASALIQILDDSASSFRRSGYEYGTTNMVSPPTPDVLDEKDVIDTGFELTLHGEVTL